MSLSNILNIIISVLLTSAVTALVTTLKKTAKEFKALQKSQRIMIKDRLVSAHDYFCTKGTIGKYSLETLEELYGEYKDLGGNGFVKSMMNEIRKITVK